jgi:hemerythrin-like metal-binding protein
MAEFFEWNRSLDLGINEMNDEHKHLIAIMNRLHAEHEKKASKDVLGGIVQELASYTTAHFRDEEAFMARVGYPKLDTHKIIHKNLISRLESHMDAFKQSGSLDNAFFEFLQFWLSAHIRGIDMQYAEHCRGEKVA